MILIMKEKPTVRIKRLFPPPPTTTSKLKNTSSIHKEKEKAENM
jgi:hypothetical protein